MNLLGVNGPQTYKTRKVKLPLLINNVKHDITATELPQILIALEIPGIDRVVREFSSRGYAIADKQLGGSGDVRGQVLLGSRHSKLLPVSTVVFGDSTYLNSALGVLFEGDLDDILINLPNLTTCSPSETGNYRN